MYWNFAGPAQHTKFTARIIDCGIDDFFRFFRFRKQLKLTTVLSQRGD